MKKDPIRARAGIRSAFTLVEMLIIIAIISILMTVGAVSLGGMGGKGVTSGVATAEALFDEARTTAIGRNLRTAVLVAKDLTNSPGDNLRRMIVAVEKTKPDGTPDAGPNDEPSWVLTSRGALLPEQVYFSSSSSASLSQWSDKNGSRAIPEVAANKILGPDGNPVNTRSVYRGTYYAYSFNGEGICEFQNASGFEKASFVIAMGARPANAAANTLPKVTKNSRRDFGGFVVWRNGSTSVFRTPDQISKNLPDVGKEF